MNQLDKKSYTVFLNSTDKVSGSNNNGTYQINWDDFLPRDVDFYKVVFSFQTSGGYYKDNYSTFQINLIGGVTNGVSFQCATTPTYNPITGLTSILISFNAYTLYAGNYIIVSGIKYLITQSAYAIGDTMIIQGNPIIAINTSYIGTSYNPIYSNTLVNYTGSLSRGQTINSNGASYNILNILNLNTNSTVITVSGVPTLLFLPINVPLYASNGTTYNGARIVLNSLGRAFSFDTSTKSQSLTLGYGFRDVQISTSNSNCFSTFYMQNAPKTISRPNQNMINIQIYNNSNVFTNGYLQQNQLLVNTDYFSNPLIDMTNYSLVLEIIPLEK